MLYWPAKASGPFPHCSKGGFDIPKGGYARIYPDRILIYTHHDQQVGSRGVANDCRGQILTPGGKDKP